MDLSTEDIPTLAEFYRRMADRMPSGRVAIVVPNPQIYETVRMWQMLTDRLPFTSLIRWRIKLAFHWLQDSSPEVSKEGK